MLEQFFFKTRKRFSELKGDFIKKKLHELNYVVVVKIDSKKRIIGICVNSKFINMNEIESSLNIFHLAQKRIRTHGLVWNLKWKRRLLNFFK